MNCALIITTYNWPEALELTLQSVITQTKLPNEIIVADDGSTDETKALIKKFAIANPSLKIIHSWQKDEGFRASSSRNKAIEKSTSEYIILIDGDIILEKHFIEDHIKSSKIGYFTQGSRVLIQKKKTQELIKDKKFDTSFVTKGITNRKNAIHSRIFYTIFSKNSLNLNGIKTCNFSLFRGDCIKVNGFNEDFIGWGREDSEFAVRLMNLGLKRQNIRFYAIVFHLYHKENSREMLVKNDEILKESIQQNSTWCKNGIDKYLNPTPS